MWGLMNEHNTQSMQIPVFFDTAAPKPFQSEPDGRTSGITFPPRRKRHKNALAKVYFTGQD
jgi:hypothetical protein